MIKIKTKDGSVSFINEKYSETYHSVSGAIEESFEKFAKPCSIKPGFKILDICFGIGYNSLAAISLSENIEIIGIENDKEIIKKINEVSVPEKFIEKYDIIKKAAEKLSYQDDKLKIKIIIRDAREEIKKLKNNFDCVFLDPFSPKKCPELWTEDFFRDIFKVMKKCSILTTYSCAKIVRDNLKKAGFHVKDGPCIGRRAPSTIALKK